MIDIVAYVDTEDLEKLTQTEGFKPLWNYIHGNDTDRREWGKLVLGNTQIRFLATSEVKSLMNSDPNV